MGGKQTELPGFERKLEKEQHQAIAFFIDEIQDNMRSNDFQRDFFEDLCAYYEKHEYMSDKQIESLRKIYERVTND